MRVSSRIRRGVAVVSVHGPVLRHHADVFAAWIVAEKGDRWPGPVLVSARAMTYVNSAGMRPVHAASQKVVSPVFSTLGG